jgi:ribosome-associated protein
MPPGAHVDVVDHLLRSAVWTASRSSGPGGQHRDKASTRAELTIDATALDGLSPVIAERLRRGLHLDSGPLRIVVQDDRSLARNQELAAERLAERVAAALRVARPRRATRPGRNARQRRLTAKAQRGDIKRLRQSPVD